MVQAYPFWPNLPWAADPSSEPDLTCSILFMKQQGPMDIRSAQNANPMRRDGDLCFSVSIGQDTVAEYIHFGVVCFADVVNDLYKNLGDKIRELLHTLKRACAAYAATAREDVLGQLSLPSGVRAFGLPEKWD
jgi:hypothetical protein